MQRIIEKAKTSAFHLKMLNFALSRTIPFNKPHGFKLSSLGDHYIEAFLPYKRANFNHIRGIHACALATLSEFTTGALLIFNLDVKKYRLILQSLQVNYHYQCKTDALAKFEINKQWLDQTIIEPLREKDSVLIPCEIKTFDTKGNLVCTATVNWQIKDWEKVKTKV